MVGVADRVDMTPWPSFGVPQNPNRPLKPAVVSDEVFFQLKEAWKDQATDLATTLCFSVLISLYSKH